MTLVLDAKQHKYSVTLKVVVTVIHAHQATVQNVADEEDDGNWVIVGQPLAISESARHLPMIRTGARSISHSSEFNSLQRDSVLARRFAHFAFFLLRVFFFALSDAVYRPLR